MTVTKFRIGHASLQFSDSPDQWRHDSDVILKRGYPWITGTEVGETDNWRILQAAAHRYGYTIRRYKSNWIAVQNKIIKTGTFRYGVKTVVDNDLVAGRGHDTNYLWVSFTHKTKGIGKISVVCSHYPTKGVPSAKDPSRRINLRWTRKIALAVSAIVARLGKGGNLAFYGGDQNIPDNLNDTFFGGPLTSCWDEVGKHPNTGHGNIDVIASYDGDGRVKCVDARVFTDKQVFLYADHYLIEADYEIRHFAA